MPAPEEIEVYIQDNLTQRGLKIYSNSKLLRLDDNFLAMYRCNGLANELRYSRRHSVFVCVTEAEEIEILHLWGGWGPPETDLIEEFDKEAAKKEIKIIKKSEITYLHGAGLFLAKIS